MLTDAQTSRLLAAPGPNTPALVQTWQWLRDPAGYVEQCQRRYGSVFRISVSRWGHLVMIGDPDLAKAVFMAPDSHLSASDANEILRPVVGGKSLFCLEGEQHRKMRQLVAANLGHSFIRNIQPRLLELVLDSISSLIAAKGRGRADRWRILTMRSMLLLLAGIDDEDTARKFVSRIRPLTGSLSGVFAFSPFLQSRRFGALSPIMWFDRRLRELDRDVYSAIELAANEPDKADTLIGRMTCDASVSPQAVRDQVVTMMIAGSDTTAAAIDWAFHWLYGQRNTLEKVREILVEQPEEATLRVQWILSDPAVDSLYLEAMRFLPVADFNPRVLRGVRADDGLPIIAAPCALMLHRNAGQYADPDIFDHNRFKGGRPSSSCFIPFGGGNRYCPGSVLATTLIKLVIAVLGEQVDVARTKSVARPVRRNVILAPRIRLPGALRTRQDRDDELRMRVP
jgi:cytochrome P450